MELYTNATFLTCEDTNRVCTAMAVNKGHICWIGNEADVPSQYRSARRIDLGGATVTPGFGDTHMHFESLCVFENTFYLVDVADFDQAKAVVQAYADKAPKAKVLIGYGCSAHTVTEKRLPERKDLDQWTTRPLMVVKYDGHAAVCNSALLALLSDKVKSDPGCHADTGWLNQNAFFAGTNEVTAMIPTLDIVKGLSVGADSLARVGISMVHNVEGVGYPKDLDVDMINVLAPGLPQAYRTFFQTMDVSAAKRRHMHRIGGCFQLALDGCFGSEDAALSSPYANDPDNYGMLYYTQEQVNAFAIKANRAGMQIAMHAIGDAAVEQCINAYEAALADFPREDHRHVLIHCCMCTDAQLDRIAKLGLSLAVQSPFIYWRQEPDAYLASILGRERTDKLNPLKSMLDRGILIGDGSDGPTTRPAPLIGMSFAVNHPNPAERISRLDALKMITANPAKMSFDEKSRGTLTPGKIADFVVLSDNPLEAPRIEDIQVRQLYLAGKPYRSKKLGVLGLLFNSIYQRIFRKQYI